MQLVEFFINQLHFILDFKILIILTIKALSNK